MNRLKIALFSALTAICGLCCADNQTNTLSPVFPEASLPFRVQIELADFELPNGLHSYAFATHKGKWLLIAGRTNGMHSFNNDTNNFPPSAQNTVVYVVDPHRKTVSSASLHATNSGLTQQQIDYLSVTSPQFYQLDKTLYITGGYGVDTATGQFSTKPILTAIDVPGLIHWVTKPHSGETALQHIRQLNDPIFQITGGYMDKPAKNGPMLLIFGQNFIGYYLDTSNGIYSQQIRRFNILDNGTDLGVEILPSYPPLPDPSFRRRDLNVVPIIYEKNHKHVKALTALSGVFTLTSGIWTVPVKIKCSGKASMANPLDPTTFKQSMNNYTSATLGMYSNKHHAMYTLLLGGISYGYFQNGVFQTDSEIPFINQVTTVKIDKDGLYTQHLMSGQYPVILSQYSNPGNPLLFGAAAQFISARHIHSYGNSVVKFDRLKNAKILGYIVGGIQSTVPNTNTASDSAASPYIFTVKIIPTAP